MNNNIVDISYHLKTLQLSKSNNENDKVIKIKPVFKDTITLSGSGAFTGNTLLTTNNLQATPDTTGFNPSSFYNDRWYVKSNLLSIEVDVWYIDGNYEEQVIHKVCTADAYVQLPLCRWVNKFIKTSGNIGGSSFIYYEPNAIYTGGLNFIMHQSSSYRAFSSMYMCPKNKTLKLNSIDYYRNLGLSNLLLLKYEKGINKPTIMLSLANINGVYSNDNIYSNIANEGDILVWYNVNSANNSTSNTIDSTFEINNI